MADPHPDGAPESLPLAKPTDIPVFNCVIYISKVDGGCLARNGHWTDLERKAANERDAIRQLVTAFKAKAAAEHAAGASLPFNDDPVEPRENETVRLVPVHL